MRNMSSVTRDFGRGQIPLSTLRDAARNERADRRLADEVLRLISEWENSPTAQTVSARDELRWRVKQLVPPETVESTSSSSRKKPTESIYAAGLRGQKRHR